MKRRIQSLAFAALIAIGASGCDWIPSGGADNEPFRSRAPVYTVLDLFGEPVGTSTLFRNRRSLSFRFRTTDLQPGHAYTLWMVIFNEPENCQSPTPESRCSDPDTENEAAKPDIIYAAGRVVGASGEATFAGHRSVGDDSGSISAPVGLPAYGLMNPLGAEIHLVVHHHGPMLAAYMPDMIQTVAGGCQDAGIPAPGVPSPFNDYQGPEFGRRGPNTCQTIQVAFHTP